MKKSLFFLFLFGFSTLVFSQTVPPNTRIFQPTNTFGYFNNSFIKHLNSSKNEIFLTVSNTGGGSYYGQQVIDFNARFVSRIGQDGIPKWTAKFKNETSNVWNFDAKRSIAAVDANDNIIVTSTTGSASTLTDAFGNTDNITYDSEPNSVQRIFFKLDKDGNKIWIKKITNIASASVSIDNNNDVYVFGTGGNSGSIIDGISLGNTFIIKLNGNTGNIIYAKTFNYLSYQFIPVFDSQNVLYVFTEPAESPNQSFSYDNVSIPSNSNGLNSLMLKMDTSGNVIWGKNFYTNLTVDSYSWINDAVFDGTNFIVMGNLIKSSVSDPNYLGMDGVNFPAVYSSSSYQGLIAKINLTGNVIWQKIISTSQNAPTGFYTNINLDENKNFYGYFNFKNKISVDNVEYNFDENSGNKVISKFDNNGNLKYFSAVDNGAEYGGGISYNSRNIDVIANDQFNISGITYENHFLNYPITNTLNPKFYVATFGNLDTKYLTPESNYMQLSNVAIPNNLENANTFSFNLVNNVNWTATSDQNWLNLSYEKLAQKGLNTTSISDNGDALITLTAETNNTGANRTANILVSGDGNVSPKTIAVTQSGILATGETKTFVTTLYPNPTSDILNIETQQNISKIEIFDMTGKLLKTTNGKDKKVSVSQLTKGMYLIKLYTENGVVNSKFIKN
ncbi:T9SS type A sorting domain-containing protein [Kaistella sp.]|uniref:T9SS type A sorting domain-containing protein n=1 Tax=Kaistella sp. TaxID=2782235 RepID=UPI003C5BC270